MLKAVLRSMERMRDLLQQVNIDIDKMNKKGTKLLQLQNLTLWSIYAQEISQNVEVVISKLDFGQIPDLKGELSSNESVYQEIVLEVEHFKQLIRKANYPCIGCCG